MNHDILLSKIVPNSTDTSWAQVYTTLNVYVAISIESEKSTKSVTSTGKDLLEKLQREFFALDEKTLENIKNAVGNVTKTIPDDYQYSMLVGTIVNNVLYIVIASEGQVAIKRGDKLGIIATGIANELHGFSGKLEHDDILLFQTGDFTKKFPFNTLSDYLKSTDVSQIAEDITPIVHEGSKGTESAIIIQFKNQHPQPSRPEISDDANDSIEPEEPTQEEPIRPEEENLWTKQVENRNIEELVEEETITPKKRLSIPSITLPKFFLRNRKVIIITTIILLIVILAGSILYQTGKNSQSQAPSAEFTSVLQPIQSKYDEGAQLANLNQTLALESLNNSLKTVTSQLPNYKEGSSEHTKLLELKTQIESKIEELDGGGEAKNIKEFLTTGDSLESITAISVRSGNIHIIDSEGKKVVTFDDSGDPQKTYEIDDAAKYITSDDQFIYALGDSITKIDVGNGEIEKVVANPKGTSIQSFGSNIYTVTDDDILKYRAPTYSESSYFTESASFKSTPVSIGISGPVWVLENDGTIERFTRGVNDDVQITGLNGPIGENASIHADSNLDNVYVLDSKNQRVVVLSSEGEYTTQYEGSFLKNSTSLGIDEENGTGYVVSDNKVFSFDL